MSAEEETLYDRLRDRLVELLPGIDHQDTDSEILRSVEALVRPEHFGVEGTVAGTHRRRHPVVIVTRGGLPLLTIPPDSAVSLGTRLIAEAKQAELRAEDDD